MPSPLFLLPCSFLTSGTQCANLPLNFKAIASSPSPRRAVCFPAAVSPRASPPAPTHTGRLGPVTAGECCSRLAEREAVKMESAEAQLGFDVRNCEFAVGSRYKSLVQMCRRKFALHFKFAGAFWLIRWADIEMYLLPYVTVCLINFIEPY